MRGGVPARLCQMCGVLCDFEGSAVVGVSVANGQVPDVDVEECADIMPGHDAGSRHEARPLDGLASPLPPMEYLNQYPGLFKV